jgi:hypothetical protein
MIVTYLVPLRNPILHMVRSHTLIGQRRKKKQLQERNFGSMDSYRDICCSTCIFALRKFANDPSSPTSCIIVIHGNQLGYFFTYVLQWWICSVVSIIPYYPSLPQYVLAPHIPKYTSCWFLIVKGLSSRRCRCIAARTLLVHEAWEHRSRIWTRGTLFKHLALCDAKKRKRTYSTLSCCWATIDVICWGWDGPCSAFDCRHSSGWCHDEDWFLWFVYFCENDWVDAELDDLDERSRDVQEIKRGR